MNTLRNFSKLQIYVALVIALILVGFALSLTKQSFNQAKEKLNKDNLYSIQTAIKTIAESQPLAKVFPDCIENFCVLNPKILQEKFLDPKADMSVQLLPQDLATTSGELYQLKVSGDSSYIIQGNSALNPQLCWIISDNETLSNFAANSPTECQ